MEEQKTVIVEKRLSRGVIRRRTRAVKPKLEETDPSAKKAGEQTGAVKKASQKVKKVEQEKLPTQIKKVEEKKTEQKKEAQKKSFILSDEEKSKAEKNVKKYVKVKETKEAAEVATKKEVVLSEDAIVGKEKIVQPEKEKKPKEEKPKVLSFKDRIRGHIDLKKTQTVPKKDASKTMGLDKTKDQKTKAEEEKAERQRREKILKTRKGVKSIGGDLDIEGLGRTQTLAQLTRTTPSDRVFRPDSGRRKKKIVSRKNLKQTTITTKKASKRYVEVDRGITVGAFAQELGVKAGDIIKKLMELGVMASINQEIDKETATLVAEEYQYEVRDVSFKEEEILAVTPKEEEQETDLPSRPPVVTVMGHVDHGKTSLLDRIRATNVVDGEAGGITQHIGAYTVDLEQGKITFLDTPGHEAFTTMRLRGAKATDIVVLVVAADDGMMPQTEESINHAQAAGVPIIVAVNKIDKPEADPEKIKRQLSEKGLVSEEWGGDVIFNHVSAKQGTGIDTLLESILLQSEMLELKAREEGRAKGIVLEARLDRGRGPVCSLLVQEGTLKTGDYVVAGFFAGRVRSLSDWKGDVIEVAGPSMAVEILGVEGVPEAGEAFHVVDSEQDAKSVVQNREIERRRQKAETQGQVTLEDMFSKMQAGEISELGLILKTDVHGSLEAVRDAVMKIGNDEVKAKIVHAGVGGVNESDVQLAQASKAIIIGFNVRPETKALHLAKEYHVDIRTYKIIYDLVNDVKLAMQGLLEPDLQEKYLGRADVRQAFEISGIGTIAGSMVIDGMVTRNANLRLLRDNVVLFEGKVCSLKRFKNDAKEVKQGFECGIGLEGYSDIKSGDVLEAYEIIKIQKTL